METTWQQLVERAHARSTNGDLFPLANGQETTTELRRLCRQLIIRCPCQVRHPHCPFHLLSQHPPGAVRRLIENMPDPELREMFVLELIYRTASQEQEGGDSFAACMRHHDCAHGGTGTFPAAASATTANRL